MVVTPLSEDAIQQVRRGTCCRKLCPSIVFEIGDFSHWVREHVRILRIGQAEYRRGQHLRTIAR